MKIAVVGATGRIGAGLTRRLLAEGHQVKALSRGGAGLDALVKLGAEPVLGSFDTGAGDIAAFFQDADAAFLMVKTDWNNIDAHYPVVAQRFVDALRGSPVKRAVSLTAMGSDIDGATGHSECFHHLDEKLNELDGIDLVHLRAGWFMENMVALAAPVAQYGRIAWNYRPDLKMPWVATDDIAWLAAQVLTGPDIGHRVALEVGSEDLSMSDVAAMIGHEIGRPVEYRHVDIDGADYAAEFLARFGTADRLRDDRLTADAYNEGVVRFHLAPEDRPQLPTRMAAFVKNLWRPFYDKVAAQEAHSETLFSWTARDL